ncbi:C13-like peptidase [Hamiltosporidium tvaerminnensis]|uniref:C13-like peptidase n=1 Tax=Hamiltosporidium tvaerminnensis TaxID=1176355 RepID=A0A4Q9LY98_9MICR|nr:C13-like peptidase [Hamiltosporidium tvaerminnensis]
MKYKIFFLIKYVLTKNIAILINGSRYFHNYRHTSNILAFYSALKQNGFEDTEILIVSYEDITKDPRNIYDKIYFNPKKHFEKIDIIPFNLTINNILNVLYCKNSKIYDLDETSNVFIYMCGHGGEGYIKLCNREYLLYPDIKKAIMYLCKRVGKVLFINDTCQAESIFDGLYQIDNLYLVASSERNEPSISTQNCSNIGPSLIDNFPYKFLEIIDNCIRLDLNVFFDLFDFESVMSHVIHSNDSRFKVKDFFVQRREKELFLFMDV